jgi:hypothetical protein
MISAATRSTPIWLMMAPRSHLRGLLMSLSDRQLLMQLVTEMATLRQQMAELKAEQSQARQRRWVSRMTGKRLAVLIGAVLGTLTLGSLSWAASTGCPNGLPVCFQANTPALAGDMNLDLSTIKDWIESKVGAVTTGNVTIAGTTQHTNTVTIQTTAAGNPLVVTGPLSDGYSSFLNTVEFRNDTVLQGIGIGYGGVYATGASQDLDLTPRGSGEVVARGNLEATGELRGASIRNRNCAWGTRGPGIGADNQYHSIYCPTGQYMAGWQCYASDRIDGDCAAWCCSP